MALRNTLMRAIAVMPQKNAPIQALISHAKLETGESAWDTRREEFVNEVNTLGQTGKISSTDNRLFSVDSDTHTNALNELVSDPEVFVSTCNTSMKAAVYTAPGEGETHEGEVIFMRSMAESYLHTYELGVKHAVPALKGKLWRDPDLLANKAMFLSTGFNIVDVGDRIFKELLHDESPSAKVLTYAVMHHGLSPLHAVRATNSNSAIPPERYAVTKALATRALSGAAGPLDAICETSIHDTMIRAGFHSNDYLAVVEHAKAGLGLLGLPIPELYDVEELELPETMHDQPADYGLPRDWLLHYAESLIALNRPPEAIDALDLLGRIRAHPSNPLQVDPYNNADAVDGAEKFAKLKALVLCDRYDEARTAGEATLAHMRSVHGEGSEEEALVRVWMTEPALKLGDSEAYAEHVQYIRRTAEKTESEHLRFELERSLNAVEAVFGKAE